MNRIRFVNRSARVRLTDLVSELRKLVAAEDSALRSWFQTEDEPPASSSASIVTRNGIPHDAIAIILKVLLVKLKCCKSVS